MALASSVINDFGGGIWDELDGPAGYVYDALDAIVAGTDVVQRGGTAHRATEDGDDWLGLAAADVAGDVRVVTWGLTSINVLAADEASMPAVTPASGDPSGPDAVAPFSRAVSYCEALVMRSSGSPNLWVYAGSRKATVTKTITVAAGSVIVTGTGFTADVDPGMLLSDADGLSVSVVKTVDSNTQLTLTRPRHKPLTASAHDFTPLLFISPTQLGTLDPVSSAPFSAIGTAGNKLLVAVGSRVWVSRANDWEFNENEYHDLGSEVLGIEGFGASALVFSKAGVYTIDNVALDLTDDAGNPQQQLRLLSPNVVLWGDSGIASWEGRVVVPALDDVYLFTPGEGPAPVSRGIRNRHRAYVRDGRRPGVATTFEGHYVLPITDPVGLQVDELVCRLDQTGSRGGLRPAWTRWAGEEGMPAAVVREPKDDGTARLTGVQHAGAEEDRLLDLSACVSPSATSVDAGGSVVHLDVTTNDMPTGPDNANTVMRAKVRYSLSGTAPTLRLSCFVGGSEDALETVLTPDGPPSDGEVPEFWPVVKRCTRIRFRIRSAGGASKLRVRSLETLVRPSNRR